MRLSRTVNALLVLALAILPLGCGSPAAPIPEVPAFRGVEGYGTSTPAGRGGQVIRVTNLNDNGPGSLRDALADTGRRTVIFDVSGYINLDSNLCIGAGSNCDYSPAQAFVTVAGQTAPSPGITIRGGGLLIRTNDVLIQHLRVRPGIVGTSERRDAILIESASRVVLDHVSVSWAGNGGKNFATLNVTDVTVSNCITSEAFPYGMLISEGDRRVGVQRCLFAHNYDRNPQVKGGSEQVLVNNEIYNPGGKGRPFMGVWNNPVDEPPQEGPNRCSIIGNTAAAGPTGSGLAYQFEADLAAGSECYLSDNSFPDGFIFQTGTGMAEVTAAPFALPDPLTVLKSSEVEASLRANAGARPADRDPVDTRIMNDVINRTGNSLITNEGQVGGYPVLAPNTRALAVPANHAERRPSGYTVLEEDILFPLAAQVEGRH
jgi:pectate lyase